MRHLGALALAVAMSAASVDQTRPTAPQTSQTPAVLMGQVVGNESEEPVADAIILLRNGAGEEIDAVRSTQDGRFLFTGVPPGEVSVGAARPGYLATSLSTRPRLTLAPAEWRTDLLIRLKQMGVVTGRVVDDRGEPVVGVTVQSYRPSSLPLGTWTGSISTTTDDRGEYRLAVSSGDYVVGVPSALSTVPATFLDSIAAGGEAALSALNTRSGLPSLVASIDRGSRQTMEIGDSVLDLSRASKPPHADALGTCSVFPSRYYPAGRTPASAGLISVQGGAEHGGTDLVLTRARGVTVAGSVTGVDSEAPRVMVRLYELEADGTPVTLTEARAMSRDDGGFAFHCVPPGRYRIDVFQERQITPTERRVPPTLRTGSETATAGSAVPPAPPRVEEDRALWASVPLTVGSDTVAGLRIPLQEGRRFRGRVEIDGDRLDDYAGLGIYMWSADGHDRFFRTNVSEDGTFASAPVPDGPYHVNVSASRPWVLKSMSLAGHDVTDTLLEVNGTDVTGIVAVMTDQLSEISGRVMGRKRLENLDVMIFPANRALWPAPLARGRRRVRSATTDANGRYRLDRLLPGEYLLVAVEESPARWMAPEHLERLARLATHVDVGERTRTALDLELASLLPSRPSRGHSPSPGEPGGSLRFPPISPSDPGGGAGPFVPADGGDREPQRRARGTITGRLLPRGAARGTIRGATVVLRSLDGQVGRTTISDDDGAFVFESVPAGRYRLAASKPAFLEMEYGARQPGRAGTPVIVNEGQATVVEMEMQRGAVIAGRVTDDMGRPLVGATVRVLQVRQGPAGLSLEAVFGGLAEEAVADDRGIYRIFGLPPGEYYVGAAPPMWGPAARALTEADFRAAESTRRVRAAGAVAAITQPATPVLHQPAFHPAAGSLADAFAVAVGSGEQRSGVDVVLHLVPEKRIAGRLVQPDGTPAAGVTVSLFPTGLYVPSSGYRINGTVNSGRVTTRGGFVRLRTSPEGTFEIRGLTATSYRLLARAASDAARGLFALEDVTVAGLELKDLEVQLRPGLTVRGTAVSADPTTTPALRRLRMTLTGTLADGVEISVPIHNVHADGRFEIEGLLPGRYLLSIDELPSGWWPESAMLEALDPLDEPVTLAVDASDLQLTLRLTQQPAQLSGRFVDPDGRPMRDVAVLLFPADPRRRTPGSRLQRLTRPDDRGRYVIRGLAPGRYLLAAVTDAAPGDEHDPGFLALLESGAIPVSIAPGEHTTQDVQAGGGATREHPRRDRYHSDTMGTRSPCPTC